MKEGYNNAAVDFLISDLLKHALTKNKKGTETSVTPKKIKALKIMRNL